MAIHLILITFNPSLPEEETRKLTRKLFRRSAGTADGHRPSTELQQLHPWDIKQGEDEARFRQRIAPLLAEEVQKITFESIYVRKDGRTYPVEVHLQRFQYNVQPVLMQIVIDITERKRVQAELQRAKDKLAMYLEVAASIFIVVE